MPAATWFTLQYLVSALLGFYPERVFYVTFSLLCVADDCAAIMAVCPLSDSSRYDQADKKTVQESNLYQKPSVFRALNDVCHG